MKLRTLFTAGLLLLCSFSMASFKVEDEMGLFEINELPKRIVVLEFSFVDALANLGVSPVGVADDGDMNKLIGSIRNKVDPWTSVGSRYQPNLEIIASLKPDLIVADLDRNAAIYDDLKKIAPTIVLKSRGETYQENIQTVVKIGAILNKPELINEVVQSHQARMDEFASRVETPLQLQFAVANERGLWMHGPQSYAGSVMERLGITTATHSERETAYIPTTLEQLVKANPDVLLIGKYGTKTVIDQWQSNNLWSLIGAVKSDQYHEVDPRLWSLNRGMIAAEIMAEELVNLINAQ